MKLTPKAIILTGLMTLSALATLVLAISAKAPLQGYRTLVLLALALVTSRLKVKLPGLTGNMAVNLPFLLIAIAQLSLLEALLVALPSCALQCLPRTEAGGLGRPKPIQMLFNLSTTAVAAGVANLLGEHTALLSTACFFMVQTIPVAGIIALTEGGNLLKLWSKIAHLSFPFYVLSAGIASIVIGSNQGQMLWQLPLIGLPVLYAVYCSYRTYFDVSKAPAKSVNFDLS